MHFILEVIRLISGTPKSTSKMKPYAENVWDVAIDVRIVVEIVTYPKKNFFDKEEFFLFFVVMLGHLIFNDFLYM
jgi:hypothetical protein